jgi:Ni/Fe-hydrogenase 1 B-type cytochrome subunit
MPAETVRREAVWSGRLRALHWTLALATLLLLASGWLLSQEFTPLTANLRSVHVGAGVLLSLALTGRLMLLVFGRGAEHLRDFRPSPAGMLGMLRFYVTAGRAPLPAYYAHNPLWAPLYLLLFATLALQAASGLTWLYTGAADPEYFQALPWLMGWTLSEWHLGGYRIIAAFTLAHILAVFWHDWKGTGAEISALLNGHKIFIIRRASDVLPVAWKKTPGRSGTGDEPRSGAP